MTLFSCPRATAGYSNHFSCTNGCVTTIENDDVFSSPEETEHHVFVRTTEFINKVSHGFFNQAKTPKIKALQDLLWFVSKNGVTPIRDSLFKERGFFSRLFSNESWEDWFENKKPLGKVICLYCDCVTSSTRLEVFMERLDEHLLEVSNNEAALLLKSLKPKKNSTFKSKEVSGPQSPSVLGAFPAVIQCLNLKGVDGFIINGQKGEDGNTCSALTGTSVSRAGDVNGDGIDDLIIGAPGYDMCPGPPGRSYIVFGEKSWNSPMSLSDLNGVNGYKGSMLDGSEIDLSGGAVSGAGDINGDGIDDLIIGAFGANPPMTFGYVVFGKKGNWNSPIELSMLDGSNGFSIYSGTTDGSLGIAALSVSGAGDINGDGIDDLILGDESNTAHVAGWTFVLFGSRSNWSTSFATSHLDGTNGFSLYGINTKDQAGKSVSLVGDINADGLDDFIIGAPGANAGNIVNAGCSYLIYGNKGKWSRSISLSDINGVNGLVLNGLNTGDQCGSSVSGAGDINGDGIADFIIGAPGATVGGNLNAGQSYVVFGSKTKWKNPFSFAELNGNNGFAVGGVESGAKLGGSVRGAGDINGDGIDDLIIGAPKFVSGILQGNGEGRSYVIFGKRGSWITPFDLSTLNGANGFMLDTYQKYITTVNVFGISVSGAGDINDDGVDDLVIGASPQSNNPDYPPGNVYVIYGKKTTQQNTSQTNQGLIIGLSVGGGVAVVGFVALGWYIWNKQRNRIAALPGEKQPLVN